MNVSIVEDPTRARLRFHNLMKSDIRIESTLSREGNLFYKWKDNEKVHCVRQLYEGIELGYELQDVQFCFDNSSFQQLNKNLTKTDQLSLIIFHLNTRSLVKHYDELESQLDYLESPPDTLCLTGTLLKDNMTP